MLARTCLASILALICLAVGPAGAQTTPPNILLIVIDDPFLLPKEAAFGKWHLGLKADRTDVAPHEAGF